MIERFLRRILKRKNLKNDFKKKGVRLNGTGYIDGNIKIGFGTYINSGYRVVSGSISYVKIGRYCAIGRNFSAASRTHDLNRPTADEENKIHKIKEQSIDIGNYVWIGDNVFIKEGVQVDDYSVIGANSVVVRNVEKFEIVGGNPARHIRLNTEHYKYRLKDE